MLFCILCLLHDAQSPFFTESNPTTGMTLNSCRQPMFFAATLLAVWNSSQFLFEYIYVIAVLIDNVDYRIFKKLVYMKL